ncbi:HTH domain-containing protein [Streptomyces sp. NPDC007905]|uniref:helix-turn-helix transcriptional regulator n=1 Tax=Streptomyces sp. NPDC007905 TaxID=3364788 RepID=UPI0036E80E70
MPARRFEVSVRTIERDLLALQRSGVPIHCEPGRSGGYVLDRERTLPPLTVTPAEATALAVGLHALTGTPFAAGARSALHEVPAVLPGRERRAAAEPSRRVHLLVPAAKPARSAGPVVPARAAGGAAAGALAAPAVRRRGRRRHHPGHRTDGLPRGEEYRYLTAWCRLRNAPRGPSPYRIRAVEALDERAPDRALDLAALDTLGWDLGPSASPERAGNRRQGRVAHGAQAGVRSHPFLHPAFRTGKPGLRYAVEGTPPVDGGPGRVASCWYVTRPDGVRSSGIDLLQAWTGASRPSGR